MGDEVSYRADRRFDRVGPWGCALALAGCGSSVREQPTVANASAASNVALICEKSADCRDYAFIEQSIDSEFSQWSQSWMMDRYVDRSSHATEIQSKSDVYLVRGDFKFIRYGGIIAIPFSVALKRQGNTFTPIDLCYNDTSSGMTDCVRSTIGPARRQFLRMVILGGVLTAVASGGTSTSSSNERDRAEAQYWENQDRNEKQRIEEQVEDHQRRVEEQIQRERSEPSPLLDPP
jgi:hypothetical protein